MEDILFKQSEVLKCLHRIEQYLKRATIYTPLSDLRVRRDHASLLLYQFKAYHQVIVRQERLPERYVEMFAEFKYAYYRLCGLYYHLCMCYVPPKDKVLNKCMEQQTHFNVGETSTSSSSSSEMDIPPINGNFKNWQKFYDYFIGAVHNNPNLRDSEKLRRLQRLLRGGPLSLINHLEPTDANYIVAMWELKKRCNKPVA